MSTTCSTALDPERLIGEIIEQRYAVVEWLGATRYVVYDMQRMQRRVLPLAPDGTLLAWDSVPPPVPADARRAPSPPRREPAGPLRRLSASALRRVRVDSLRFEAAWFARGEQLEHEEDSGEVTDYPAYQAALERLALEMG